MIDAWIRLQPRRRKSSAIGPVRRLEPAFRIYGEIPAMTDHVRAVPVSSYQLTVYETAGARSLGDGVAR